MDDLEFILELQETFLTEAAEQLDATESLFLELEKNPDDLKIIEKIFRLAHTIKGSAGAVEFTGLAEFAHIMENLLVRLKKTEIKPTHEIIDLLLASNDRLRQFIEALGNDKKAEVATGDLVDGINRILQGGGVEKPKKTPAAASAVTSVPDLPAELDAEHETRPETPMQQAPAAAQAADTVADPTARKAREEFIRLPLGKIDTLLNYLGEQVILQATLEQLQSAEVEDHEAINGTIMQLGKLTNDIQHTAMSLRMLNLKGLFNKMQRTARDTAKSLDKKVNIIQTGEDTELDKVFIDELSGAVTHLIRNALDHGIESPAERLASNKPETASLDIHAFQECGYFFLEIKDDGRGIDKDKIFAKAVERGIVAADAELTDDEIYKLLFISGLSTAERVTDVSGRGVGMDAVQAVVNSMRGSINLTSKLGHGTTVTIKLPLSMAIFNGIVFKLSDERYILPSSEIKEVFRYQDKDIRQLDNSERLIRKGETTLTLHDLRTKLRGIKRKNRNDGRKIAVVVNREGRDMAFEVDDIIGQQRIVQKKLGTEIEGLPGISGGAILGDGHVALILNLNLFEV